LIFSSRWTLPSKIIFLCVDRCAGRPDDGADGIVRNRYLSENAGGTPRRQRWLPMPGEKTPFRGGVSLSAERTVRGGGSSAATHDE